MRVRGLDPNYPSGVGDADCCGRLCVREGNGMSENSLFLQLSFAVNLNMLE